MSQQNKTDSHALPYCLLPDVSSANATSDCVQMIEETTHYVIASVDVITATRGVLINAALRTAAEAITSQPALARKRRREFVSFP
jgi:hypothetical protein